MEKAQGVNESLAPGDVLVDCLWLKFVSIAMKRVARGRKSGTFPTEFSNAQEKVTNDR
jgi:hypothetical protein